MPTGAKSNIRNGAPKASLRNSATMILGGVPISVIIPPRIEANDKGINDKAGLLLAFFAACISTGINNASAATLFIIADKPAASAAITLMCAPNLRVPEMTYLASSSMAPEFDKPRLIIRTSAMIAVAGCPKPENANSEGTTPVTSPTSSAMNATRS